MARRLKLALIGFLMVTSAHANGSMGREVSVIVVHPSSTSRAISEAKQFEKDARRQMKEDAKAAAKAEKSAEKAKAAADKAYEKKLAKQRKKK